MISALNVQPGPSKKGQSPTCGRLPQALQLEYVIVSRDSARVGLGSDPSRGPQDDNGREDGADG